MTTFDDALLFTMKYEVGPWFKLDDDTIAGLCDTKAQKRKTGYVNDPDDPGGETKFGVAKNSNPGINIKKMSWPMAKTIYQMKYWKVGKCELLPGKLAFAHFDACVNHGPKTAIKMLQRAVGVNDDGALGPATLKAVNQKLVTEDVLKLMLNERRKFFAAIVAKNPTQKKFLNGWLNRVLDIERSLA